MYALIMLSIFCFFFQLNHFPLPDFYVFPAAQRSDQSIEDIIMDPSHPILFVLSTNQSSSAAANGWLNCEHKV